MLILTTSQTTSPVPGGRICGGGCAPWGGVFFFWRALSAPQVTCYVMKTIPDRDRTPIQEPDGSPMIMCYAVDIDEIDEPAPDPESTEPESEPEQ